ncbi:MAG: alpha/beta hydrolase-fold protein [Pseudomonadota bacterium]
MFTRPKLGLFLTAFLIVVVAALLIVSRKPSEYVPTPIAGVEMQCFEEIEPVSWSYCINRVEASTNTDIIYYLHARNGNATWWNDRSYHTAELYKVWDAEGQDPPTVVAISFGKLWMLSEHDRIVDGGLYGVFLNNVIPRVEAKLGAPIGQRMVAGISMGGFNTLLLALKSKGVFVKAASICSPLPIVSHHDGLGSVITSAKESDTSFKRALLLWQFSRQYYPSREIWKRNNPLSLSTEFDAESGPALYLTCGKADDWGCFKGSELLAANIDRAGGSIEWVPREGGHCDMEYTSLANFLQSKEY